MRFGRDSRFSSAKILVAFCTNFGVAQQAVVSQALLFVLLFFAQVAPEAKFYVREEECSVVTVWCRAAGLWYEAFWNYSWNCIRLCLIRAK